MADKKQVILLMQGLEVWNKWRNENREVRIDLTSVQLSQGNLSNFNLNNANLNGANLSGSNLNRANLHSANLSGANLSGANLSGANLHSANLISIDFKRADLSGAYLIGANLKRGDLRKANFVEADLSEADLTEAYLDRANLSAVNLISTNLNEARLGGTIIASTNLIKVLGLENIKHQSPSAISLDTIQMSKGEVPEMFLRGCGLSDWEIESAKLYKPGLSNQEINTIIYKIFDLRAQQSIQISPLFISYSHADTPFVEKLEPCLTKKGIRFWRDVHNATVGRLETQIDRAMRQNPTVILILSEDSIRSDWVEHEARLARELEKEMGRDVLCPIALDDSWKSAKWPVRLMEQIMEYNILDYSKWNDDIAFERVFNKMISGLDMFYKPDKEKSKY
jgi:hypothetical protein